MNNLDNRKDFVYVNNNIPELIEELKEKNKNRLSKLKNEDLFLSAFHDQVGGFLHTVTSSQESDRINLDRFRYQYKINKEGFIVPSQRPFSKMSFDTKENMITTIEEMLDDSVSSLFNNILEANIGRK